MRTGVTQSSPTANPLVTITIGADVYSTADGGRLLRVLSDEQGYGGWYEIFLDNSDEALNAKDYKGSILDLNWSFVGESGSSLPPLYVHDQAFISREGKLVLQLNCMDEWGKLSFVEPTLANAVYNFHWQQTTELDGMTLPSGKVLPPALKTAISNNYNKTIYTILGDLVGTISKTVVMDVGDNDGIIDAQKPPIHIGGAITGIRQLLEMTGCYLLLRYESGATKFRVIQPSAHSTAYSFNTDNLHFSNVEDAAVVAPNHIYVWAYNTDGSDWIYGEASDAGSISKIGDVPRHYLLGNLNIEVYSNTTALNSLASGILTKIQGEMSQGTLVAPMHCSLELFDKISVTDSRYGTPKTTTGYVHRIVREYDRGVYRVTIQLGGVTSGYTPAGGGLPTPLAKYKPFDTAPISSYWTGIIPKAIQGFQHNITFVSDSQVQVSWGAGTIKFYDGITTQSINAGNTGTLPDTNVRYIYFDLADASPAVLKVTADYQSVMTPKTGVVCIVQRGSDANTKATFIPSFGKTPLITADILYLTGLLDKLPDGTYGKVYATDIQAGHIKLSATFQETGYRTVSDGEKGYWDGKPDTMDEIGEGTTYQRVLSTDIASGHIKLTSYITAAGKWYDLAGVSIDASNGIILYGSATAFRTRATYGGADQCYMDSSGAICAGAGTVILDAAGIKLKGDAIFLQDSGGTTRGYLGGFSGKVRLWSTSGNVVEIGNAGDSVNISSADFKVWCSITAQGAYTNHLYDIHPYNTVTWLGASTERFALGYIDQIGTSSYKAVVYCNGLSACPMPAPLAALGVIKRIPNPVNIAGHFGEGTYFDVESFPDEMKMDVIEYDEETKQPKPVVKRDIEIIRTVGILVQAVRELTAKVEELEGRIP